MFARTILVISLLLSTISLAAAASPEDVAKVAAMVTDPSVPVLLRQQEFVDGKYMGDTIVFVHGGMRYTIYNTGRPVDAKDPKIAWIAFWTRKDGSSGEATMDTFSDNGFDGIVDFGIDGPRKHEFLADFPVVGMNDEKRAYWQPVYDAAINAALEYKRRVKK